MKTDKLNLRMLLEEEGEDDGGEISLSPDDEAADDAGDTVTDEEEAGASEEEEEVEVDADEEIALRKPLEAQVDSVLGDFEMAALKSAKVNEALTLQSLLVEEEQASFDVESFAADVARLINNYETLLDIEQAIYYRAINMLETNSEYPPELAEAFKEILHGRYGFDFGDIRSDPVKDQAPLALGSGGEGAGGA